MDKRSSARAAAIAARVLDGAPCTKAQAKTLAASVLAQRIAPAPVEIDKGELTIRIDARALRAVVRATVRHELRRGGVLKLIDDLKKKGART